MIREMICLPFREALVRKILIILIDSMSLEQREVDYSKMWYVREKDGTTYKI
jgi:hypothetical protein